MLLEQLNVVPVNADTLDGLDPNQLDVDKVDGSDAADLGGTGDGSTISTSSPFSVLPSGIADGITIVKNGSGKLENQSLTTKIGDFETDFGSWTKYDNSTETASRGTNTSKSGSYSIQALNYDVGDKTGIERTMDLTPYNTLKVPYSNGSSNIDKVVVELNGTVVTSTTTQPTDFATINVDVGSYGSSTTIRIYHENTSGAQQVAYFDDIQLEAPESIVKTDVNGAGGTA